MNRITKINPAIAPQAHAAIAKRCLESINGIAIFKGLCYEVTVGGEVWHIGNGTQTFENTWNDASFGFEPNILAADTKKPTSFRNLKVGQTFDFIDDSKPHFNSFFNACVKVGPRHYAYRAANTRMVNRIGSINAAVHHVDSYKISAETAAVQA